MPRDLSRAVTNQVYTTEDASQLEKLMSRYGPSVSAKISTRRKFRRFCVMNNFSPQDGFPKWVAQLFRLKYAPGTVETYMNHVVGKTSRIYESCGLWPVRSAVQRCHADSNPSHALDGSREELLDILDSMSDAALQTMLWLIVGCGARASDAARLSPDDVCLSSWEKKPRRAPKTPLKKAQ